MARPSFTMQHFVFSESLDYRDRSRPHRDTILDGVDYVFRIPSGTEFPFEPNEFWLFVRLFSTSELVADSEQSRDTRPLWVVCYWLDSPTGEEEVGVWARNVGSVAFLRTVIDRAWVFRNLEDNTTFFFPGPGRYMFKLGYEISGGPYWRVKAREYIRVEAQS